MQVVGLRKVIRCITYNEDKHQDPLPKAAESVASFSSVVKGEKLYGVLNIMPIFDDSFGHFSSLGV